MPDPYRVNKAGSIGLIDPNDLRPYELPKEAWNQVQNIRMINGAAQVTNGRTQDVNLADLTINALDFYNGPTNRHRIAYGDQFIRTVNASGAVNVVGDMAALAGTYPDQIWVTGQFNSIPIATNFLAPPQCQYNAGGLISETTPFVPFPDWATSGDTYFNATCRVVVPYKNFIVAINIIDVNNYPNLVAWSDVAEPGLMPASWDYNDPATLAGRRVVGADDGKLVAALPQRGSLIIYAEWGTYRMTFVRGSEFVMEVDRIFDNFGAFGPRSVGAYGGRHLVVTKDDIIAHDGQNWDSVGEERIRNRVFLGLTEEDTNRVYVAPYLRFSEMWVGVPAANSDNTFDNTLTWRWSDQVKPWSVRSLPDARYAAELPILQQAQADDTWDGGPNETWDGGREVIWDFGVSASDLRMICSSTDGYLYEIDNGVQTEDGFLERDDINLSSDLTVETITSLTPRIQSEIPVEITIGASMTVEGPIKWAQPAVFDPSVDHEITRMATGRRHAVRFRGTRFRLEGYDIVWEYAGER